jgi:phage gpG-like protein
MQNDFYKFYRSVQKLLPEFVEHASNDALNFYKASFTNQGFTNRSLERWQARKINKLYLKRSISTGKKKSTFKLTKQASRANNALLIKSGRLRRSLRRNTYGLSFEISSDVPYAQIQNEGGMAGRQRKSRIPKRQFVGESEVLWKSFENTFDKMMTKAFNL